MSDFSQKPSERPSVSLDIFPAQSSTFSLDTSEGYAAFLVRDPPPDLQRMVALAGGWDGVSAYEWWSYRIEMAAWNRRRLNRA